MMTTGGCIGIWRLSKRLGGYTYISRMEVISEIWRLSETRIGIELLWQLKSMRYKASNINCKGKVKSTKNDVEIEKKVMKYI